MAHGLDDTVRDHPRRGEAGETEADGVDPPADPETGHIGKASIERRHRVPEIRLGAADAGVPAADRPVRAFVPLHRRAVLRRRRAFATHLVEAVAVTVPFVAPRFDVLAD